MNENKSEKREISDIPFVESGDSLLLEQLDFLIKHNFFLEHKQDACPIKIVLSPTSIPTL